jgi:hypothetical protein
MKISYFVTYPCPSCKAELEAQHGAWQGWLRCPACGQPSPPPEMLFGHPETQRRMQGHDDDGPTPNDSIIANGPPIIASSRSTATSVSRMFFISGLVMSLFVLLIAYLDQNPQLTGTFGAMAIIFFLLLLRNPRRRGKDED